MMRKMKTTTKKSNLMCYASRAPFVVKLPIVCHASSQKLFSPWSTATGHRSHGCRTAQKTDRGTFSASIGGRGSLMVLAEWEHRRHSVQVVDHSDPASPKSPPGNRLNATRRGILCVLELLNI